MSQGDVVCVVPGTVCGAAVLLFFYLSLLCCANKNIAAESRDLSSFSYTHGVLLRTLLLLCLTTTLLVVSYKDLGSALLMLLAAVSSTLPPGPTKKRCFLSFFTHT